MFNLTETILRWFKLRKARRSVLICNTPSCGKQLDPKKERMVCAECLALLKKINPELFEPEPEKAETPEPANRRRPPRIFRQRK